MLKPSRPTQPSADATREAQVYDSNDHEWNVVLAASVDIVQLVAHAKELGVIVFDDVADGYTLFVPWPCTINLGPIEEP